MKFFDFLFEIDRATVWVFDCGNLQFFKYFRFFQYNSGCG